MHAVKLPLSLSNRQIVISQPWTGGLLYRRSRPVDASLLEALLANILHKNRRRTSKVVPTHRPPLPVRPPRASRVGTRGACS